MKRLSPNQFYTDIVVFAYTYVDALLYILAFK